jgi:hypothetical protein
MSHHSMKGFKMPTIVAVVLAIALPAFWLVSNSRAATETPEYTVVSTDGKFEIRDYPPLTLASTAMKEDEMNGGFGQLFRFITGKNEGAERIAMTSPVLIDTAKEAKTMSFIMPKAAVEKGVPKPVGDTVNLAKLQASRFAVLRFAGSRTVQKEKAAIEALKELTEVKALKTEGEPLFAYYDPPWTPVFMRRNEVLIRIAQQP